MRVHALSKALVSSVEVFSRGESQSSINNDLQNWLVLHGNENVVFDDVCGIGKKVEIDFQGDKNNMFDVLSGVGRKNLKNGGCGA